MQMNFPQTESLKIHDIKNEVQITLASSLPFEGHISPVYTQSAESSAPAAASAELFQAYTINPCCNLSLDAGEKWEVEFTLRFSH
jgi:hypothetical protein